jgi:hypothetical protein
MGKNDLLQEVGLLAAGISLFSFYSLVFHNFQIQDPTSLSWTWLLLGIVIQILWIIYGFANSILPTMLLTPLILIGYFGLLYLKVTLETDFFKNKK